MADNTGLPVNDRTLPGGVSSVKSKKQDERFDIYGRKQQLRSTPVNLKVGQKRTRASGEEYFGKGSRGGSPPNKTRKVAKSNGSATNSDDMEIGTQEGTYNKSSGERSASTSPAKWKSLTHNGPMFAPPYASLPAKVKFYYNNKHVKLSQDAEEVAGFYGKLLENDFTKSNLFNNNFLSDWRSVMTYQEKKLIKDLSKCDFREICEYYKKQSEDRRNMSKEEKQQLKKEKEELVEQYGYCIIDEQRQKIGNYRIEPPGLFRGRGDHPKQGMLKRRIEPSDVILNLSEGSNVPRLPRGMHWKAISHDHTVTWLASWIENVQGSTKYIMLSAASDLRGEKDKKKFDTARKLHKRISKIRDRYRKDLKAEEMGVKQRAVAMYFIDNLALRAGNEKEEDTADTVGCCSLRVEHVKLYDKRDGKKNVVVFDFLGKDSIRYNNEVSVNATVFKNLKLFTEEKRPKDHLFDHLNTRLLNKHLKSLMNGLTAKVFRTYNASRTLQEQLDQHTVSEDNLDAKLSTYNRANGAVAVLCNHQRAVPKNFDEQMEKLQSKIDEKKDLLNGISRELKVAKLNYKATQRDSAKNLIGKIQNAYDRTNAACNKLKLKATKKNENKTIALGTSKLNYLDPRITTAWCRKFDVPIERIYNKTQIEKFSWAIKISDKKYRFC